MVVEIRSGSSIRLLFNTLFFFFLFLFFLFFFFKNTPLELNSQHQMSTQLENIKSVAVIGGGPCGVAALKALIGEKSFDRVIAFERRSNTGGLWNYHNEDYNDQQLPVPSIDPHNNLQTPFKTGENEYIWPCAIYELLDTNVPYKIMEYQDFHFPVDSPIFPLKVDVLKYIQDYSKSVEDYIQFDTNVVDVSLTSDKKYSVTYRTVCDSTDGGINKCSDSSTEKTEIFDAVLIAAGHYDQPFVPYRPGLKEYSEKHPGSVSHAKSYKHPRQFKDVEGNILIIGNSASGSDLAYQLATGLGKPIYKSARSASQLPAGSSDLIKTVKDVESIDPSTKDVKLIDGTVISNVDRIIFATGYLRHYPFLKSFNKSSTPFITTGERVERLYRQVLSYDHLTLAFIALPRYILPTRTSEAQAAWVSKVLAGKIKLPSKEIMQEDEQRTIEDKGTGPGFHNLFYPEDVFYSLKFNKETEEVPGWETGLIPCRWTEEELIYRSNATPMKEAFIKYKEKTGKLATTLEELEKGVGYQVTPVDKNMFPHLKKLELKHHI